MKKDRKKAFVERLGEAVLEIVVSVIFFGIGAWIVYLFEGDPFGEHADFDGIVLIGILVLGIVSVGIGWIIHLIRKKKSKQTPKDPIREKIERRRLRRKQRK